MKFYDPNKSKKYDQYGHRFDGSGGLGMEAEVMPE
jgi:DnaJ-class molecular chaperone